MYVSTHTRAHEHAFLYVFRTRAQKSCFMCMDTSWYAHKCISARDAKTQSSSTQTFSVARYTQASRRSHENLHAHSNKASTRAGVKSVRAQKAYLHTLHAPAQVCVCVRAHTYTHMPAPKCVGLCTDLVFSAGTYLIRTHCTCANACIPGARKQAFRHAHTECLLHEHTHMCGYEHYGRMRKLTYTPCKLFTSS